MEALGSLGINGALLIAFLVNFAILFVILSLFAYKPIVKMLNDRQTKIKESMELAEKIRQDSARSEEEIKSHLETARKEGQNVVAQASQIGERLKEEARQSARQEAESLITKARAEIQREREKSVEDLRAEFADIAILAAEKVINETLDKKKHQKIINDVLKESAALKKK